MSRFCPAAIRRLLIAGVAGAVVLTTTPLVLAQATSQPIVKVPSGNPPPYNPLGRPHAVKAPPGPAGLTCTTMDRRCEATLTEKLKANPRYAKETPKIVASVRADYRKAMATHRPVAGKPTAALAEPWYCSTGLLVSICISDDGVQFYW